MDWDILPCCAAWWPRCGSFMLCSDGPPLLDGCRWLSLVRFPVVACVEPWVCLSFSLILLLLSLALLLLVHPAAYPTCFCLLPRVVRFLLSLCRSTRQGSKGWRANDPKKGWRANELLKSDEII
ncbi:uncharacterized protein LOC119281316 [Triticum dicoccoides]|uniref:uncharacterized protein LOC119281316 n=1 Tax=Triticum dicoccoides TaxID=85692 RepID=UPI00188FAF0E|nr:uncharacterized protein LOC119281316 [Triticum dicoccoides]